MVTKLTLSADKDIVKRAKRLAKDQNTSVSALFEQFVRSATGSGQRRTQPVGRLTRKATGMLKLPKRKTDRELVEEAMLEKHGL